MTEKTPLPDTAPPPAERFAVAPMLDWTDRDFRYLCRLISKHCLLYTEMVTTGALLHGDAERFLAHDSAEYPLALQLGGVDADALATCASMAERAGYQEVNLNIGCPSDRVQSGRFGACLMAEPQRVAEGVRAMKSAVAIPITIKTRLGIDHQDDYAFLADFVATVVDAGVDRLIVHARKAWLSGLSPKQNRSVPPLDYARVYQLKRDFPSIPIAINGGITNLADAQQHLAHVDGVMLGRAIYEDPFLLAGVDTQIFGQPERHITMESVLQDYLPYMEARMREGRPLKSMTRHLLGCFQGQAGAKIWRRTLSEQAHRPGAGLEVIETALALFADARATMQEPQGEAG